MKSRLEELCFLLLALGMLTAILLTQGTRQAQADPTFLPPIKTVSGNGIAIVDGAVLVDINSADADLLMSLPGIGEVLAGRIIAYREEHGPFTCVDDLINVKGVGQVLLSNIEGKIAAMQ